MSLLKLIAEYDQEREAYIRKLEAENERLLKAHFSFLGHGERCCLLIAR